MRRVGSSSAEGGSGRWRPPLALVLVLGAACADGGPTPATEAHAVTTSVTLESQHLFDVGASETPWTPTLAMAGDIALGGSVDASAVYSYRRTRGGWALEGSLPRPEGDAVILGYAIAFDGATALVGGARRLEATYEWVVYVYERFAKGWTLTQELVSGEPDDRFGGALAIDRGVAVIGAVDAEAAYVYEHRGGAWQLTARLQAPDGTASERFGHAVAVAGPVVAIGAPWHVEPGTGYVGTVYLFGRHAGAWALRSAVLPEDRDANANFGWSLDFDRKLLAIGAPGAEDFVGAVYMFERSGHRWREETKLIPPDVGEAVLFGVATAVDRGVVAAGTDSGNTLYLFAREDGAWSVQAEVGGDPAGARYGNDLEIADDALGVIGLVPGTTTPWVGALYLYDLAR